MIMVQVPLLAFLLLNLSLSITVLSSKNRLSLSFHHSSVFVCVEVWVGVYLIYSVLQLSAGAERACLRVITAWLFKALFVSVCLPVRASFISAEN